MIASAPGRIGDWIYTISGPFWPLDPRPEEIHVEAIARGLAMECRFNGQAGWYPVAQHCVYAAELLAGTGLELWGLFHDSPEALGLKDLPGPVKRFIGPGYSRAESVVMDAVCIRFGLQRRTWINGTLSLPPLVKAVDGVLLATEVRDLIGVEALASWGCLRGITPHPMTIEPWPWEVAEQRFLACYRELTGAC